MTSFDDLFRSAGAEQQTDTEQVQDIALEKLMPFHNHPFQVRDDEEMRRNLTRGVVEEDAPPFGAGFGCPDGCGDDAVEYL